MSKKHTPFYAQQVERGGRFVDFGEWSLPVHYGPGINTEHKTVREGAGLFDVSHMGEIEIRGDDAIAALDRLVTNNLSRLADGQACYTAMCRPEGGIIDDLVIYRFSQRHVLICCNASNRTKDFEWIQAQIKGAEAQDRGDEFAQLAIQGPQAVKALQALTDTDLDQIDRYWFTTGQIAGIEAIISRTGYTGEDGFELYLPVDQAAPIWDALLDGKTPVSPIGLGARDTLRLEMKYALYGNDIDETTTPLEAGLGWITKLCGDDFIGRDALIAQKAEGLTRRLVAFKLDGRGIARHDYPIIDPEGIRIGRVTSGTRSPTLGVSIGMAYVPFGAHKIGTKLQVEIRGRAVEGTIVKPPFVTVA